MKKIQLKVRRQDIIKYSLFFIAFILLVRAETIGGLRPFHVGFFVALCFCRQNTIIVTLSYIAAVLISAFKVETIITSLFLPIIFLGAGFLHYKLKKPMSITLASLYGFVGQIPYLCINIFYKWNVVIAVLNVVASQIFIFCAIVILYAILVRGLRYRFSVDELVSLALLLIGLSLGLYNFQIFGERPFYVFAGFFILASVYTFGGEGLAVSFLIGLGAGLESGDLRIAAAFALMALVSVIFRNTSIYLMGASLLVCDALAGMFFNVYDGYGYIQLAMFSAGVIIFLLIPKKHRVKLLAYSSNIKERFAAKTIVNRSRKDVSEKLDEVSEVFFNIDGLLKGAAVALPSVKDAKWQLTESVQNKICEKCEKKQRCYSQLNGSTKEELGHMMAGAIERGKATLLDLSAFITSRCNKTNQLLSAANEAIRGYKEEKIFADAVDTNKLVLSEQMNGVGKILDNLSKDIKKSVSFDTVSERLIIDKLCQRNVIVSEVIIYGTKGEDLSATLVVRECDKDKKSIAAIVSAVLKTKMIVLENKTTIQRGFATVHLIKEPKYNLVYGESGIEKDEGSRSGDSRSIIKLSENKILVALCDGMGSGENAEKTSGRAIGLIENFYKAGFDNNLVIDLTNKMLTLRNEENYSALDLAVVDLSSGECDFIKMGSRETVIKKREGLEIVECKAAPVGILDNVKPVTEQKKLIGGDIVVMCSDGVIDGLGIEELERMVDADNSVNPQILTDKIIEEAKKKGVSDDMTVLAFRIFERQKRPLY